MIPPIGSIWRQEDGYLVKVVAAAKDKEHVFVRCANGRGHAWSVLVAWFPYWERTS